MEKRTLSRSGLTVSRACLGTMTFGAQTDESTALGMVNYCCEHGINFFDTANVYNQGASETILGRALRGRRDGVILASKVAGKMGPGADQTGLSRPAIMRMVEESLQRLQTDYLDLCYLHWPDYAVPVEESLAAMADLVSAGKVRHVGSSNYASWQVVQLLGLAKDKNLPPVTVAQQMYNVISRGLDQEFLPMARVYEVATVVYNPLAGGLLTGKQQMQAPLPGTRFDGNRAYLDRYWHGQNFDAVQELTALAARAGRSSVSLALNWILHHSPVDCVVIGASRREHLESNLQAVEEGKLAEETVTECDKIWAKLRGPAPKYNR